MIMNLKVNKPYKGLNLIAVLSIITLFYSLSVAQAEDWVYEVRKQDDLWNITVDHLIDISYVEKVQKLNKIIDPWHILPGTIIKIPTQWVRHFPALVRVLNLQGTAQILEDEATQSKPLNVGDIVVLGDKVSTSVNSTLVLGFLDGSQVLLQENSTLKIDSLMLLENTGMLDSQMQLLSGRMETQVTPGVGNARKFMITTPATVTSVRGTDYRISAEGEKEQSITEVVEGKVLVESSIGSDLVKAGFGTVSVKGQDSKPPVKLLSAPDITSIPKPFLQVPIQFSLPVTENIQGYRVQLAKTEEFQDILFDKPFLSNILRGPDLADGDYYIRVRAIDMHQLEGYNAEQVITINARPEAPFLVSPKTGEGILLEDGVEFSWSNQEGTEQYHLQISNTADFSKILVDISDINDSEITVTNELPLGKYYWRIAGVDHDGDGPFCDAQMFRRIVPAPEIEAPEFTDDTLTIRSRKGLPGQSYHFQMSDDESFSELLIDKRTDEPSFEIDKPNGGEYFIRVRTIDPDGFVGPFAKPQSIDIPYSLYWYLSVLMLLALIAL